MELQTTVRDNVEIAHARSRRSRWQLLRGNAPELLALGAGVVVWEALGWLLDYPWLPPFSRVLVTLVRLIQSGVVLFNLLASLRSLAIGFGFSLIVSLLVGALMARFRLVEQALDIYVHAMLFAPSIALAPVFLVIFGLSDMTRIGVVVVYSIFFMIINMFTGFHNVDPSLIEMARSFGARESQVFVRIVLPASLPMVFAAISVGMGRAVRGMINGEQFIALVGLGALVRTYGNRFDATRVLALILVIIVIVMILNWFVTAWEKKFTTWMD